MSLRKLRRISLTALFLVVVAGVLIWNRANAYRQARLTRDLWFAVDADDLPRVNRLLDAGADPNVRANPPAPPSNLVAWIRAMFRGSGSQGSGPTALINAVDHRKLEIARVLLQHGATANAKDQSGNNALMPATMNGQDGMIHLLLEAGADPNFENGGGVVIPVALLSCHRTAILDLIRHGARINPRDVVTVRSALSNPDAGVVDILLNRGLPVDWVVQGRPLLCVAAAEGNVPVLTLLLRRGADLNRRGSAGLTPLGEAISARNLPNAITRFPELEAAIRFLRSRGAKE